ncbi:MAG: hypothetical protein CMB24_04965 [Euryarchaeota archaeon]|nr:hypothetical protein [Euryarchaeota archaeon]
MITPDSKKITSIAATPEAAKRESTTSFIKKAIVIARELTRSILRPPSSILVLSPEFIPIVNPLIIARPIKREARLKSALITEKTKKNTRADSKGSKNNHKYERRYEIEFTIYSFFMMNFAL